MIRGVTKDEAEARTVRFLRMRSWLKVGWFVGGAVLVAAVVALFVVPAVPSVGKESLLVLVNRAAAPEQQRTHGVVVRVQSGKAYAVTAVGSLINEGDVGRPIEVWLPWVARGRTFPGIIRMVRRTRTSAPEPYFSYLAVIEFEAPVKPIDIAGESAATLRDARVEVWGVDPRSLKAGRLVGPVRVSRVLSDQHFTFGLGSRDYPVGAAVVVKGRLVGVIADTQTVGGKIPTGRDALAIGGPEITAAVSGLASR